MKRYTAGDYLSAIDKFAPFSSADSWDNVGLLVGSPGREISRAIVALDATHAVINQAQKDGAQLVITHHPIIFGGINSVPECSPVYHAIKSGVAVLCAHTNLDKAGCGVNAVLAELLELDAPELLETTKTTPYRKVVVYVPRESAEAVYSAMTQAGAGRQGDYAGAAFISDGQGRFLPLEGANPAIGSVGRLEKVEEQRLEMLAAPGDLQAVISVMRAAHPYEEPAYDILETHFDKEHTGYGRVGNLKNPLAPDAFAEYVREKLSLTGIKYVSGKEDISRVAVCGGAGCHLLEAAQKMGAQALISADAKHSQLLQAKDLGMTLIDAGHYGTEAVILPTLVEKLKAALPGADIRRSDVCADPAILLTHNKETPCL